VHDTVIFVGMGLTLALIWAGIKIKGFAGGITGFLAGAVLTGLLATQAGVDLGDGVSCRRYSSFADDC
jgi:uncharacterized transporter YbjL